MISILLIVVYALSLDYSTSFHQSYICASSISTLLKASRSGIKASSKAPKEVFFCDQCGVEHIKWEGRCTSCREWNTVKPFKAAKLSNIGIGDTRQLKATPLSSIKGLVSGSTLQSSYSPWVGHAIGGPVSMIPMEDVELNVTTYRLKLFSDEMNRVLGGGLVRGSVSLLAGDPGIGKSTLLLQLASSIANDKSAMDRTVVYISGEENPEQIAARAKRLNLSAKKTFLICDIDVDNAIESIISMPAPPALIIVDSIQTMRTAACTNGMGSITQIRESAARFVELAKSSGTAVLLIGHVTKAGDIAGPRVLEHMVDVVLHLEGSERSEYRLLKGIKNRFGSTAEVGVFSMNGEGMADVPNPSELFMSSNVVSTGAEGSAVAVIMEGTRPILAEIQCLVGAPSALPAEAKISPRRATDGFPLQRLQLLCAVIEKRLKLSLWSRDVYLNVVGGLRLSEPAADLAVAVTIVSSLVGMKIRAGICFIGEIGLAGEIRGIRGVELRIAEALKMGFTTVIIPKVGKGKQKFKISGQREQNAKGLGVVECETLFETLTIALEVDSFEEILSRLRGNREKKKNYKKGNNEKSYEESKSYGWDNISSKDSGCVDNEGIYNDSSGGTENNTDKNDYFSEGFTDNE